jgi:hypothetical protein
MGEITIRQRKPVSPVLTDVPSGIRELLDQFGWPCFLHASDRPQLESLIPGNCQEHEDKSRIASKTQRNAREATCQSLAGASGWLSRIRQRHPNVALFAFNFPAALRAEHRRVCLGHRVPRKVERVPCRSNSARQIQAQSRFPVPSLRALLFGSTEYALLFPPSFGAVGVPL